MSPSRVVAACTVAYAVLFFVLGWDRYATFHSGADLGLFAQTIAGAFAGFRNTFEASNHFTYHFSPILYLCAPAMWLTHSALSLVLIQSVATASIAPALYLIARRRASDRDAAIVACVALLYPPLHGVTFTDFHEVAFAPAAVAWLLWAIDARRFGIAYALLAVVLAIKEDQAPAMAFLGATAIAYFVPRRERGGITFGLVAVLSSMALFEVYFGIVRALAGATTPWHPEHFYAWIGYAQAEPIGRQIAERFTYLVEAFLPLAFVPFRSRALVLALPGFVEVLASREPLTYTMGQHYAAVWVPYVLVAFAIGGARLLSERGTVGKRWIWTSAALCVAISAFFSPLHLGHFLRPLQPQDAATEALIGRIPTDASVGTYDEIYAHLGFYPRAQIGLDGDPQFVIADSRYASVTWNGKYLPRLRAEVASGAYRIVASIDGVTLYERR
ncbi:MAG: DUF2079 domain-containing protein [Candidatus Eremiobacteraeota bacterium]|nr:DUF2079 domain-containing protein [Candidatus Eremiobacteraeota bacterium]